ncbi:MAG: protein kinase [Bifidobacterium sp.]|jgi:serine/threonine protein kinase|nr:serine/threonine protein kinase [Bifidobacterium sp.]MCH4209543.1 protein kinase [Bifidobacterium sp.]
MGDLNAMNLEPGEIVGGYELISRLGGGAMGSVWQVCDGGGQTYAMKILRESFAEEGAGAGDGGGADNQTANGLGGRERDQLTARERLRREAMALQKVRHPGVCGIVDMELDDALAFIVTELIEGKNLRQDVAANGRYTGDDLERLARKLIDAVKAVHAAGIVHRDIKPTNVMISAGGPVLVDFGIAMGAGESHVTRTGLVMGTPGFIAPEIIDGEESNEDSDWWSLASVLAFAATGHPVFGTKPMMTVLEREASGNANLAGLPASTLAALRLALDPDPRRRNSPDELLRAIALDALNPFAWEEVQTGQTGQVGSASPGRQSDPADRLPTPYGNPQPSQKPQGNGVVRPFDSSAAARTRTLALSGADRDNPRTLWPADDAATRSLQPLAIPGSTADAAMGRTAVLPRRDATGTTALRNASDAPDEETVRLQRQRNFNDLTESDDALDTTMIASTIRPALQRLAGNAADATLPNGRTSCVAGTATQLVRPVAAQAAAPSAAVTLAAASPAAVPLAATSTIGVAPTAILATQSPAFAPAPEYAPEFIPAQEESAPTLTEQPAAQNPEDVQRIQQAVAAPPNPADIERVQLLARGRIALWLLTIPIGLLAAGTPIMTLMAAIVLLWIIFAAGFNEAGQLNREFRRGGVRKGSDAALRLAALPWHIIKAFPPALTHASLLLAMATLITIPAGYALQLPVAKAYLHLHDWTVPIPLVVGGTWSTGAMTLGAAEAAGWLIAALSIRSSNLVLGAGALLTAAPKTRIDQARRGSQTSEPQSQQAAGRAGNPTLSTDASHNTVRKRIILLTLWTVVTVSALLVLASNQPISWEPLMALLAQ